MRKSSLAIPLSLSAFYLLLVVPVSARLQLWHDDVFVLAIARLGGWSSIWQGLKQGSDNLPPLDYWLHHLSMATFGESPWAFHLPSVLAIWGAMLLVYAVVSRSLGQMFGAASAILMLVVTGYDAAFLTRGHALVLLCFALALWCLDRLSRSPAILLEIVFALALVAAAYSHYYGVLIAVTFFAAICLTQWSNRRLQLRSFWPFAAAAVCCLPLVSLAQQASAYRTGFWTPVTLTAVVDFFPSLLLPSINCAVAVCLCLVFAPQRALASGNGSTAASLPAATTLALVLTVAEGVPMYVMARLSTGVFHSEYAQPAAVALVILANAQVVRLRLSPAWVRVALVVVPALFVMFMAARRMQGFWNEAKSQEGVDRLIAFQASEPEPVVLTDDALFVVLSYRHESAPLMNSYFVYDTNPALRTNVDRAIAGLTRLMPLRASAYERFRQQFPHFTVVGDARSPVITKAATDGATVTLHVNAPDGIPYWTVRYD